MDVVIFKHKGFHFTRNDNISHDDCGTKLSTNEVVQNAASIDQRLQTWQIISLM